MTKERPNIFNYATKELSQDAMICWLLECYHSTDKNYKQIGLQFIRFLMDDSTLSYEDVDLEKEGPYRQQDHMDVYTRLRIKEEIIPVMFENKTNTYLHDNQLERYANIIKKWKDSKKTEDLFGKELPIGKTLAVYFKTGYVFGWEKEELNKIKGDFEKNNEQSLRIIYLDDFLPFLESIKNYDTILRDYYSHLQAQRNTWNNLDKCEEALYEHLFSTIFTQNATFDYSYQGWAEKNIFIREFNNCDKNKIYYSIKIHWRKNNKINDDQLAVCFSQYRNEKTIEGDTAQLIAERKAEADEVRKICRKVFHDLGKDDWSEDIVIKDTQKMPAQNNLAIIFIDEKNDKELKLIGEFVEKMQTELKKRYA